MKMTLQEFCEKLFFEEETSDHERSILLVDIMMAIGFSKSEREINRHLVDIEQVLENILRTTDKETSKITGSVSEGMCGGMHMEHTHADFDFVCTARNIKLCTPRTNNVNNPPLLLLNDNGDYDAYFFVEEEDNCPGYVKLLLAEMKTNCAVLGLCRRMNDDKRYLSNSNIKDLFYQKPVKSLNKFHRFSPPCHKKEINGPANTLYKKNAIGAISKTDHVYCIHYDMWPNSANSFITRRNTNNWPSNSMLEHIKSQGCDVAPVGHHDSQNNDIQWRISFPGERNLLLDLTDVQTLCYALIKLIIREILNTSQREVVSSFHIKHVMFWCVERCSCQWVDLNYINCLNICLAQLIEMIKARHIPHYIIEGRNLFNSKMTEKMSTEIVDVLSKYDTTHVFRLDTFDYIFKLTQYNNALLKREALRSTIMGCFNAYLVTFSLYVTCPSFFWDLYIPHNVTNSLFKYVNILKNLKKVKGVCIQFSTYFVRSMLGFLYYAKYKESNKATFKLESKRLVQKSLNLDSSCIKLRGATFFLTNMEYRQAIAICNTFLTSPPRYTIDSFLQYIIDIESKLNEQLFQGKTNEAIENFMKIILPMFYSSVELKYLPANYDSTQHNPVWILRNFTNMFFHSLCMDVIFMTAEKLVVPDPIQYELLSLQKDAKCDEFPFSGIQLDPMFVCLQTKFLCYHLMENVNGMAEMLTLMSRFITETTFTTKSSCAYLNMFAYCQIKAGHHRQSVKSILQSLHIFPSRYNAASGYLNIVLLILNYFSINNC
jgi:hypothetical protein